MPATHVFSHVTAARLMDLPLPLELESRSQLDVAAAAPGRAPQVSGVLGHRFVWRAGSVIVHRGVRITAPALTWVSLATVLSLDDLVAVGDSLVSGDPAWTSIEALGAAITPGIRGSRLLRVAWRLIRHGVLSRPETHFRLGVVRGGLPEPMVAAPVWVPLLRRFLHPDLSWPEWKVAFEYEGDGHRTDTWQFRHDIQRVESMVDIDWSVSRFSADDIFRRMPQTVERARRRLRKAGWRDG